MSKFDKDGFYSQEIQSKEEMADKVRHCPSGAIRDNNAGKGRMDLLPGHALLRLQAIVGEEVYWPDATIVLAKIFENGANHYADRNWEQGMYVDWFIDSGQRHLEKAIAGWHDEPHLFMALWNFLCLVDTVQRVQKGLLDEEYLGHYKNLGNEFEGGSLPEDITTYTTKSLVYLAKYNIYKTLAGGGPEYIYYASIFLYEAANRLAYAIRTKKPNYLGVFRKLYDKEGACV